MRRPESRSVEAAAPRARRWRPSRPLVWGAVVALVLAAFGGGTLVGWRFADDRAGQRQVVGPEVVEVPASLYADDVQVAMPDLRGLAEADAREVLADVGVPSSVITTSSRPAAGAVGVVVEQSPAFGTENPDSVELVISELATVPEAVGQDARTITAGLEQLGAAVVQTLRYVPGADPGTVLSISPAPGDPLPAEVTLEVAEPPSAIFLSAVDSVDGSCDESSESVNGTTYDDLLLCFADAEPTDVVWILGRHVDTVEGTIGIPDDGEPGSQVQLVIFADTRAVQTVVGAYGAPLEFSATVTGALRLTFRLTAVGVDPESFSSLDAALADVTLIGSSDAMDQLLLDD